MKSYLLKPWPILLALSVMGCAAPSQTTSWPEPRPLGASIPAFLPLDSSAEESGENLSVPKVLTLGDAVALALLNNPNLRACAWEVRASEAHMLQAGLLPNPEVGIELDRISGPGSLAEGGANESSLTLSQVIEIGGERSKRRRVAGIERDLTGWDYEAARLDVLTETSQAFTRVVAAQRRLMLSDSLLERAREFYQSVAARVGAGKVSALEERRAQIVLSGAQIDNMSAVRNLTIERTSLASNWGSSEASFLQASGDLETIRPIPSYEDLAIFIDRNPDVARWADEMALRRANIAYEEARGIPNPVISFEAMRNRDLGETALIAGVSIPLPLFNRNQGRIQEAKSRLQVGAETKKWAVIKTQLLLTEVYEHLALSHSEVATIREIVLPAAQENFTSTQEGYREGKFDLLMVLDAQRTLFETTKQYIDALSTYHTKRAEIERIIGTSLSNI